ncbi:PREDICTED: uncharacterized protein LOC108359793, partial [Rhagoletis zephyria]|uniref:uncharacterized protein LOC108359793 n=1 Tax=Rhagoletis zephyria TaxID=28612 RepID=UPI0008112787
MEEPICAKDYSMIQLREWLRQLKLPTSGCKATLALRKVKCLEVIAMHRGVCPIVCTGLLDDGAESVSEELKDAFGTKQSKLVLRRKFEMRKWQQTESFNEYYNDKVMLANPLKLEEEELVEYIIDGIMDEQLLVQGYLQCYTSKTQLLQAFSKVRQRKVVVKSSNTTVTKSADVRCYNCNSLGHYASECRKPIREKGACYGCGSKEHRVSECPDRKKEAFLESNTFEENMIICQNKDQKLKELRNSLEKKENGFYEMRSGVVYRKKENG